MDVSESFPALASAMQKPASQRTEEEAKIIYHAEKILGKRKANGAKKLKRLTLKHKWIIALHIQGISNRDIAVMLNYSESYVSQILSDPLAVPYLDQAAISAEQNIQSLRPLAIEAYRHALNAGNIKEKIAAADKVFKLTGDYSDKDDGDGENTLAAALDRIAEAINRGEVRKVERRPQITLDAEDITDAE